MRHYRTLFGNCASLLRGFLIPKSVRFLIFDTSAASFGRTSSNITGEPLPRSARIWTMAPTLYAPLRYGSTCPTQNGRRSGQLSAMRTVLAAFSPSAAEATVLNLALRRNLEACCAVVALVQASYFNAQESTACH